MNQYTLVCAYNEDFDQSAHPQSDSFPPEQMLDPWLYPYSAHLRPGADPGLMERGLFLSCFFVMLSCTSVY